MGMKRTRGQRQIMNGVVPLIPITMMNQFVRMQRTSKGHRHHVSMLKDSRPIDGNQAVTLRGQSALSRGASRHEMGILVPVHTQIVPIAHSAFDRIRVAIQTTRHGCQYTSETARTQEGRLNNRVNCGKALPGHAEGNPQPNRVNGERLARKVQRLGCEEPTNNHPTSARRESDEIVRASGKPEEAGFKRPCDNTTVHAGHAPSPVLGKG